MDKAQLDLTPGEKKFLSMAVLDTLEQLTETSSDPKIPWDPQSRKDFNDMIANGTSLRIKLERIGFDMRPLPDVAPGEENDYMTKPS